VSTSTYLACAYYFSVPEFPSECPIVKDNALLIRDIILSKPGNPHVELGGQYDPHYEHKPAPQYKVCSESVRRKIKIAALSGQYENIFLLFRTNRVLLSGRGCSLLSGYYKVDINKIENDPNYDAPIIYAKEARFVDVTNSVDTREYVEETGNVRFPFYSDKNVEIRNLMTKWVETLDEKPNRLNDYISTTRELFKKVRLNEFNDGPYTDCINCHAEKCFLLKRIDKHGKIFNQLHPEVAKRLCLRFKQIYGSSP
jgi:hypothetical protein